MRSGVCLTGEFCHKGGGFCHKGGGFCLKGGGLPQERVRPHGRALGFKAGKQGPKQKQCHGCRLALDH